MHGHNGPFHSQGRDSQREAGAQADEAAGCMIAMSSTDPDADGSAADADFAAGMNVLASLPEESGFTGGPDPIFSTESTIQNAKSPASPDRPSQVLKQAKSIDGAASELRTQSPETLQSTAPNSDLQEKYGKSSFGSMFLDKQSTLDQSMEQLQSTPLPAPAAPKHLAVRTLKKKKKLPRAGASDASRATTPANNVLDDSTAETCLLTDARNPRAKTTPDGAASPRQDQ